MASIGVLFGWFAQEIDGPGLDGPGLDGVCSI